MDHLYIWLRPRELDEKRFAAASDDLSRVVERSGIELEGLPGVAGPIFAPSMVAFGCEGDVVIIERVCGDYHPPELPCRDRVGMNCGYCETAGPDEDLCVQACLIVFHHHFGPDFELSSNADPAAWDAARRLCQDTTGYGSSFTCPALDLLLPSLRLALSSEPPTPPKKTSRLARAVSSLLSKIRRWTGRTKPHSPTSLPDDEKRFIEAVVEVLEEQARSERAGR